MSLSDRFLRSMDWIQAHYNNLASRPGPITQPDNADLSEQSIRSWEVIDWNQTVFCESKMQEFEIETLRHRVRHLNQRIDALNGGTRAGSRGLSHISARDEAASFDYLLEGIISDVAEPIRRAMIVLIYERRKAEMETAFMCHERDRAMAELKAALLKMSRPGSDRPQQMVDGQSGTPPDGQQKSEAHC